MRVHVSVSEPWDVGEAISWGVMPGHFEKVETINGHEVALVKLDEPIEFGGESWSYLIAAPRHLGDNLSALIKGRKVPISFTGASAQLARSQDPFARSEGRVALACIGDVEAV